MQLTRKIAEDTYYIGASDRRLALFENIYPIERGVSYNSYIVMDEKTVLLDTVDHAVSLQFIENLEYVLDGRSLDYIIVNHVEPDHCGVYGELIARYPEVKLVGNQKTMTFLSQFFRFDVNSRAVVVKEGDTLSTGKHEFTFVFAPMVHWPEVMVSYDSLTKCLYSADAFGTFGALNGNLFADEVDFEHEWLDDARRYFTNIVGKYGLQTMNILKKAAKLDIAMLCPLHGPIWRENLDWYINKHITWASYKPEDENGVLVVYSSIYGNTENAAMYVGQKLSEKGIRNIHMYDASVTDTSYLLSECFKYGKIVFAAPTYNLDIFPKMEHLLMDLKAHQWQNRQVAIIECGTWALASGKKMREYLEGMKNITIVNDTVSIKSSAKDSQASEFDALVDAIVG